MRRVLPSTAAAATPWIAISSVLSPYYANPSCGFRPHSSRGTGPWENPGFEMPSEEEAAPYGDLHQRPVGSTSTSGTKEPHPSGANEGERPHLMNPNYAFHHNHHHQLFNKEQHRNGWYDPDERPPPEYVEEPEDPNELKIEQMETPPTLDNITEDALASLDHNRHVNAKEADVVDETILPGKETTVLHPDVAGNPKVIEKKSVRFVSPQETMAIEFQKLAHGYRQEGPYVGSKIKDSAIATVDKRKRREVERVTPLHAPWQGYETSFRRLPQHVKLPNEHELRGLYPLQTTLPIEWDFADCIDYNAADPFEKPIPLKFGKLLPPNYDPKKEYPYMVCLPDWRGLESDFEDMCANFFERPNVLPLLHEQQFVVLAPLVNLRHSVIYPIEGVLARFIDWVTEKFNIEGGKVHLFGKGNGGNAAVRACLEYEGLAQSVTAILGRMGTPFRPLDRPFEKVKNLNGTHCLMIVPGGMRKTDYPYRLKGMADISQTVPPVRCLHYADVRDAQIFYALNPNEVFNHLKFFRQPDSIVPRYNHYQHDDDDPTSRAFPEAHASPDDAARENMTAEEEARLSIEEFKSMMENASLGEMPTPLGEAKDPLVNESGGIKVEKQMPL